MKRTISFLFALAALAMSASADTIAYWDFNSNPPDATLGSGTTVPAIGAGTALLLGGATATFATGSGNDPAGAADNTGWNTATYAPQGSSNKMSGVQFNVSTRSFYNVSVSLERRISNTASRYARLQYSTDGTNFIDLAVIDNAPTNTFNPYSFSLVSEPGVDDNTNFAIRIVSEFESTATGSGINGYVTGSSSSYTQNGTTRFDLVTISGDPLQQPPTISDIGDQIIAEGSSTGDLAFQVDDPDGSANTLTLAGSSSNQGLVPDANIVFGGAGVERTVRVTPALGQIGSAIITVRVTDEGGAFATDAFEVTVLATNTEPTISTVPHQRTLKDTATAPIPVTVGDLETLAGELVLTATSSNPLLVPTNSIVLGGSEFDRTVTITPAPGQTGTARIDLTVTDGGGRSATTAFVITVVPEEAVILCETFDYANGSLVTNSALFWNNHSGTVGQLPVVDKAIRLTFAQNEDVNTTLFGGPYDPGVGTRMYARFTVNFSALPLPTGAYFSHYNSNTFRGRLFSATSGAPPDHVRLGVANGSGEFSAQAAVDLRLNTTHTVVTRYDVDTATITLWVDPISENDPGATATDTVGVVPIGQFSFRQNSGMGTLIVDDLKIGTTFASVLAGAVPSLRIAKTGDHDVEISWAATATADGYLLQQSETLAVGSWNVVSETPVTEEDKSVIRYSNVIDTRFFRLVKPSPNILANGNLDLCAAQEIVPGFRLPKPVAWVNEGTRTISGPYEDELSSEPWAGPAPTPVTTDGNANPPHPEGCGGPDCGVFFKAFTGNAANGDATGHLYQDNPATPGVIYTLTGWAGAEPNYSGLIAGTRTRSEFAVEFLDGSGAIIGGSTLDLVAAGLGQPNGISFNYRQFTVTATAPAGAVWVRARASMINGFANPAGGGQAYVVDDFELRGM